MKDQRVAYNTFFVYGGHNTLTVERMCGISYSQGFIFMFC